MKCRVCGLKLNIPFSSANIFNRTVDYFECKSCGYVQTEEPNWLEEAYESPINPSDTGIMARNLSNVEDVLASLILLRARRGNVVDYAGGYGFLVRLLRDKGIDALWIDPYCENLVARQFEYSGGKASLVTAFEVFEHLVNPVQEMRRLSAISSNILISTMLIPRPTPLPSEWWYYGLEHGQHVGLYRMETLKYLADKFSMNLLSDGVSIHLFTKKKYSQLSWSIIRKFARKFPWVLNSGLKSKTWTDHLSISSN